MEIMLASMNTHKLDEFKSILQGYRILTPADIGIPFAVEETGTTFCENALIKARYLYDKTGKAVIADDSGLCVDALNGAPGVYSARYGDDIFNRQLDSRDRYMFLLSCMKGAITRTARFVCSLVLYTGTERFFLVQETVEGIITEAPSGDSGFGYDPVFYLPEHGLTMAELSPSRKNTLSHRGRAAAHLRQFLDTL